MKISGYILQETESLKNNKEIAKPEYLSYKAGILREILLTVDTGIVEKTKDELLVQLSQFFNP